MTALLLLAATALLVTGAVAAADAAVSTSRATAAVAAGALLILSSSGDALGASSAAVRLALASAPLALALLPVAVLGIRSATVASLLGGLLAGPVTQLLDDPFHDPDCLGRCEPNPFALVASPVLSDIALACGASLLLAGLLLTARSRALRDVLLTCTGVAAWAAWLAGGGAGWLAAPAALACAALAHDLLRATTSRTYLQEALLGIGPTDRPAEALASVLGCADVWLAFHTESAGLVDHRGKPLPEPSPDLDVVDIAGADGPLAQLRADLSDSAPKAVAQALRGPARLLLENGRLAAEANLRAAEVSASARRLVEACERARRELERDLHDGAQRHVLTLGLAIAADDRLDPDERDRARDHVAGVLDELREVAHGIRPPQLDGGGLERGLAALADRSQVPLVVVSQHEPPTRAGAEIVYRLVDDVLRDARGPVEVATDDGDGWTVRIACAEGGSATQASSDRFRAAGGWLTSSSSGSGWVHIGGLPARMAS